MTVVGIGGGVTYSTLGSTHHAQEDVAIATAIPNLQVLAPCDPVETEFLTNYLATKMSSSTYLRLGKAGEPNLSSEKSDALVFGKLRYLKKGEDVCILGYGPILSKAIEVAKALELEGIAVSIISVHCIKPLDIGGVKEALASHKKLAVIEEMVPHGGLGSRVVEVAFHEKSTTEVYTYSLKDEFMHIYGTHEDLLSNHNLTTENIVKDLISEKLKR